MTRERQGNGPDAAKDASIGLPLAAALLFAVFLSLGAFSIGGDESVPSPRASAQSAGTE